MRARLTMMANALAVPVLLAALGVTFVVKRGGGAQVSEVENRSLAQLPAVSFEGLKTGQYTRDLELYVADHFPLREPLVALAFWLKARRGVASSTSFYEGSVASGLDDAERWGHASSEPDGGEVVEEPELPDLLDAGEVYVAETLVLDDEPLEPADAGPTSVRAGVLIHGGRGMMLFTGTDSTAAAFARVARSYARTFRKAKVHVVVTPTATPFYIPEEERWRTHSEKDNLAAIRAGLDGGAGFADVYPALEPHTREHIYYLTDHHWTALGAYYGYTAFCAEAGLTPVPLEKLEKRSRPPDVGSMYRMTRDPTLKDVSDVTEYFAPSIESEAVRFTGDDQKKAVRAKMIDDSRRGYLVFLGGDWPVMVARTKAGTGKRALVVKNSFGNAFTPFLLPHYDVLVAVDYRYTVRSVEELVQQYRISDIIVVMDTVTANDWLHLKRVKEIIKGHEEAWTIGRGLLPDGGVRFVP